MSCSAGTNAAALTIAEITCGFQAELQGLLGRTLVLVAHPDDETACAALLQRARGATVLFATDGAPQSDHFWGRYGSRSQYAEVRSREAKRALAAIGIHGPEFLQSVQSGECFNDQELFEHATRAFESLLHKAGQEHLDAIVAPAYEGGHPDHDTCSFLAYSLGGYLDVEVWEMPLYHRGQHRDLVHQQFLQPKGTEIIFRLTPSEREKRAEMLAAYTSQPDACDFVNSPVETYRPQPAYDFSRPPHGGKLNYEAWCWPMSGAQVCQAFQSCFQMWPKPATRPRR